MASNDTPTNREKNMIWQTVIGLEVHAQLSTRSKLFSNAPTQYGAPANSQTNYIDAGFPGVLPVLNQRAVQMAIQFGLAVEATINNHTYFERKNYFYPDLPKGYQISQLQRPIIEGGHLDIVLSDKSTKKVSIHHAHLEEDAGKSLHDCHPQYTGIDLNRAGTPLLEIVTTPCLYSAEEAISYLKALHQLVKFLGICDGNLQEGSFRCDVNLSLRRKGEDKLGTRTELKNINSFRFIEKAIQYEACRHQDMLESGQVITQETRLYNPDKNQTEAMRSKENENDYRYFPDPDLLPIFIEKTQLENLKATLPPLPAQITKQLEADGLQSEHIDFILSSPNIFNLYSQIQQQSGVPAKLIINWLKGPYSAALNERGLTFDSPIIAVNQLSELLKKMNANIINHVIAKKIFAQLLTGTQDIAELIELEQQNLKNNSGELEEIIRTVISEHPQQVTDYRAGKEKLLSFFVGIVMKKTKGQAEPALVNALLIQLLK